MRLVVFRPQRLGDRRLRWSSSSLSRSSVPKYVQPPIDQTTDSVAPQCGPHYQLFGFKGGLVWIGLSLSLTNNLHVFLSERPHKRAERFCTFASAQPRLRHGTHFCVGASTDCHLTSCHDSVLAAARNHFLQRRQGVQNPGRRPAAATSRQACLRMNRPFGVCSYMCRIQYCEFMFH